MDTPRESAQESTGSPLISEPNSEDSDEHIPEPDPNPDEIASTPTLQDTLQSIFGSDYSAMSEVEDIRSVASQNEKSLPFHYLLKRMLRMLLRQKILKVLEILPRCHGVEK